MLRWTSLIAVALAAALAGCGGDPQADAAQGAAKFLSAVQRRDRVAFEASIDRQTVREDLRRQITDLARSAGLEVDGGPTDLALDRRIAPDAFQVTDARTGQPLAAAPSAQQLGGMIQALDKRHACLEVDGACRLKFGRSQRHGWRLVSMQASETTIPVQMN